MIDHEWRGIESEIERVMNKLFLGLHTCHSWWNRDVGLRMLLQIAIVYMDTTCQIGSIDICDILPDADTDVED